MIRILFVCMGNICRSPTAQGVFRQYIQQQNLQDKIFLDSAGTHAHHIGEAPDHRSQIACKRRGIDISDLRARRAIAKDFEDFDYILAMDEDNYSILKSISDAKLHKKLFLFMDFAPDYGMKYVPDPYFGGDQGFEQVLDMVQAASKGLLQFLKEKHNL